MALNRTPGLLARWQDMTWVEAIRLRETLWGPLEDLSESRRAQAAGGSFADRLMVRAQLLAQREGWEAVWRRWSSFLMSLGLFSALVATLAGIGVALSALGDGTRPVNLLLTLLAFLGLHFLTFSFWLLGVFWPGGKLVEGGWAARLCLFLGKRLVRGPDVMLIPQALTALVARARAQVWCFGVLSHALWLLALLAAFCTAVAMLAARSYQFNWETTLLEPHAFVWLTQALGALPGGLGFAMPSPELILLSDGQHALDARTQALWSSWLLGALLTYGLIPRAVAFGASLWQLRRISRRLTLDESLPGLAVLRPRLLPTVESAGQDAPEGADRSAVFFPDRSATASDSQGVLLGLEWPSESAWPPVDLPNHMADWGRVDSRAQRLQALAALQAQAPVHLFVVCNLNLTPDRGYIATLVEWAQQAHKTTLLLVAQQADLVSEERRQSWRARLLQAGFTLEQMIEDPATLDIG